MKIDFKKEEYYKYREKIEKNQPKILSILLEIKKKKQMEYLQLIDYVFNQSQIVNLYENNNSALKNVYHFFELMKEYNSLSEFIEYVRENKDSDQLKQVGIQENKAVKLLTIHKAKGLDFETEFFYWNPGSGRGNNFSELKFYINFDENYEQVEDYLLTNTEYKYIFENLDINFIKDEERKALMEEINNFYVALTRAEKNLFLYIKTPRKLKINKNKGSWVDNDYYGFYEKAVLNAFEINSLEDLINGKSFGKLNIEPREIENIEVNLSRISSYFKKEDISPRKKEKIEQNKNINMNLEIETKRIEGLAIHYYLENVIYNQPAERKFARNMVLSRYGNILGPDKTEKLLSRIDNFIENHPDYFNDKWDIFTEYELKVEETKYRIDRLLVNKDEKQILIVDYKTGSEMEESQLDEYEEVIKEKTDRDFMIESEFVLI